VPFSSRFPRARSCRCRIETNTIVSPHSNNNNNNNNGAEVEGDLEYRSISDYVGGLHGGKYEFDTRISGVTSLNYEKSHVFDDTTRSSQKGLRSVLAPYEDGEHVPSWATRQIQKNHPILRTIDLNSDVPQTMVTIKNDELTWEPFFAAIECRWGDQETSVWSKDINVAPSNGTLAPRGGIDVYSDVWDLVVFRPNDIAAVGEEMPNVLCLCRANRVGCLGVENPQEIMHVNAVL
jgi:hypothetical protein